MESRNVEEGEPVPDRPGVYRILKDGEILYVGQSNSIKRRCSQYVITNDPDIEVKFELMEDREERLREERKLIEQYEPRLNKSNNASRNKYEKCIILDDS